jgi:hypothetical protein
MWEWGDSLAVRRKEPYDGAKLAVADQLQTHVFLAIAKEEAAALPKSCSCLEVLHETSVCGINRLGLGW